MPQWTLARYVRIVGQSLASHIDRQPRDLGIVLARSNKRQSLTKTGSNNSPMALDVDCKAWTSVDVLRFRSQYIKSAVRCRKPTGTTGRKPRCKPLVTQAESMDGAVRHCEQAFHRCSETLPSWSEPFELEATCGKALPRPIGTIRSSARDSRKRNTYWRLIDNQAP